MIFQAMRSDDRLVKVYGLQAEYEINDENRKAYLITNGNAIEVPYMSALDQIAGWREHDERVYKYNVTVTGKQFYLWAGLALILAASVVTVWALVGGWFA